MPEIKIDETITQQDKVFFAGTAHLSERDAEAFEQQKRSEQQVNETVAVAGETETGNTRADREVKKGK